MSNHTQEIIDEVVTALSEVDLTPLIEEVEEPKVTPKVETPKVTVVSDIPEILYNTFTDAKELYPTKEAYALAVEGGERGESHITYLGQQIPIQRRLRPYIDDTTPEIKAERHAQMAESYPDLRTYMAAIRAGEQGAPTFRHDDTEYRTLPFLVDEEVAHHKNSDQAIHKAAEDLEFGIPQKTTKAPDVEYDDLKHDAGFMKVLRSEWSDPELTDDEVVEKYANFMHMFDINTPTMAFQFTKLKLADRKTKDLMRVMLEKWETVAGLGEGSQPLGEQFTQISKAILTDPFTFAALFTGGFGFIGKKVGTVATKKAVLRYLRADSKAEQLRLLAFEGFSYGLTVETLKDGTEVTIAPEDKPVTFTDTWVKRHSSLNVGLSTILPPSVTGIAGWVMKLKGDKAVTELSKEASKRAEATTAKSPEDPMEDMTKADEAVFLKNLDEGIPAEGGPTGINFEKLIDPTHSELSQSVFDYDKLNKVISRVEIEKKAEQKVIDALASPANLQKFFDRGITSSLEPGDLASEVRANALLHNYLAIGVINKIGPNPTAEQMTKVFITDGDYMNSLFKSAHLLNTVNSEIGRTLQMMGMKVDLTQLDRIETLLTPLKAAHDEASKRGLQGDELTAVTSQAINKETTEELIDAIQRLNPENYELDGHLITLHKRTDNWLAKTGNVFGELWTASVLFGMSTMLGAYIGIPLKKGMRDLEVITEWMIGKSISMIHKDPQNPYANRISSMEMKAALGADYTQSWETVRALRDVYMTNKTGDGVEVGLNMRVLDHKGDRIDPHNTRGTINAEYIGYSEPSTKMQKGINNALDAIGTGVRTSYQGLKALDDMGKRTYFMPSVKRVLIRQALKEFPKGGIHADAYVASRLRSYDIHYLKKGERTQAIRLEELRLTELWAEQNPGMKPSALLRGQFRNKAADVIELSEDDLSQLASYPVDESIYDAAIDILRDITYQTELPLDGHIGTLIGLGKTASEVPGIGQTFGAFYKTVFNMSKDTLQRTPGIQLLSRDIQADYLAGGIRRNSAISKMLVGYGVMELGAMLYKSGEITLNIEAEGRGTATITGEGEYQMYIPGTDGLYVPLNRMEPWGSLIIMGGLKYKLEHEMEMLELTIDSYDVSIHRDELIEIWFDAHPGQEMTQIDLKKITREVEDIREADMEALEKLKAIPGAMYATIAYEIVKNKTMAKNVQEVIDIFTNKKGTDGTINLLARHAVNAIPMANLMTQVVGGPTYEAKNAIEQLRKKLGLMSAKYGDRPEIDLLGRVRKNPIRLPIVRFRSMQLNPGIVAETLHKYHPNIKVQEDSISIPGFAGSVDLNPQDYYDLRLALDKVDTHGRFMALFNNPEFKNLPEEVPYLPDRFTPNSKQHWIREVYKKAKSDARKLFLAEDPKRYRRLVSPLIQEAGLKRKIADNNLQEPSPELHYPDKKNVPVSVGKVTEIMTNGKDN